MQQKKILLIGYGDIAKRLAQSFIDHNATVIGVARSVQQAINGVEVWQGDVNSAYILDKISKVSFDLVYVTLTPSERGEEGYHKTYYTSVKNLLAVWQKNTAVAPKKIFFISSTSVYHQQQGEIVNEASQTLPQRYNGKIILATEQLLSDSPFSHCIVRFSGIYGEGRDFLVRQVKQGALGDSHYTNRIHVQDCVSILFFLGEKVLRAENIESLYLATDSLPVESRKIRLWMAEKMALSFTAQQSVNENKIHNNKSIRGGNKKCSNQKLLMLGYIFKYPSYKEGYNYLCETS